MTNKKRNPKQHPKGKVKLPPIVNGRVFAVLIAMAVCICMVPVSFAAMEIGNAVASLLSGAEETYTWKIPVSITVEKGGSADIVEKEFQVDIQNFDWISLLPDDTETGTEEAGTEDGGATETITEAETDTSGYASSSGDEIEVSAVLTLTASENGYSTYSGTLTVTGNYEAYYYDMSDGFYVCLKDDGADGWTYDKTVYYVCGFRSTEENTLTNPDITIVDDGEEEGTEATEGLTEAQEENSEESTEAALTELAFTCTYTGYKLTFETNGGKIPFGEDSITSEAYAAGTVIDSLTLNDYVPERDGYTFAGWYTDANLTTAVTETGFTLTADTTIYAKWTVNTYTLTFETNDGTITVNNETVTSVDADYGTVFSLADLATYEPLLTGHTFAGWYTDAELTDAVTDDGILLTEDTTIYASWTVNKYTVTWKNADGSTLATEEVEYGTTPSYSGTPTQAATAQYTYTFAGWDTEVAAVTGNATYTATYTSTVNTYTLTFETNDGTITVNNETVTSVDAYYGTVFSLADLAAYEPLLTGHTFAGWYTDAELTDAVTNDGILLTENMTIYASWTVNKYTVTWKNADGSTLTTEEVEYGTTPSYSGTPTQAATAQCTYTFAGWDTEVAAVTGDATYTATYTSTANTYTLTFETNDGTITVNNKEVTSVDADYGTVFSLADLATYEPLLTGHTFAGWYTDAELTDAVTDDGILLTEDTTIYASWTVNKYTVTWKNADGSTLTTEEVEYGTTPSYSGTPTQAATAMYTYTFAGWDTEVAAVTGDATYTATYNSTVNKYTVKWVDADGTTVLETDAEVEYGKTPSYDSAEPTKASDAQYTYTFAGWTPTVTAVTGDVTYTATYTQEEIPQETPVEREGYYLALGDNMTSGDGLLEDDESVESFVSTLADLIGIEDADKIINKGTERQTTAELLEIIQNGDYDDEIANAEVITITIGTFELREAFYQEIAEFYNEEQDDTVDASDIEMMIHDPGYNVGVMEKAQILLAMLNTKDYRSQVMESEDFRTAIDVCADNICSIAAAIQELNPDAVVMVANQYNPYQWITGCDNIADLFVVGEDYLNGQISENSSTAGYYVVDLCTVFAASETSLTNADVDFQVLKLEYDFLPNEQGHQVIAEAMADVYAAAKSDYVWEIPVAVTAANGGSVEAVEETFEVEVLNLDGESVDVEGEELSGTMVLNTVSTDGSGTYYGTLIFAGNEALYSELSDGFYVRIKKGGEAGWTYDDSLYYVTVSFAEADGTESGSAESGSTDSGVVDEIMIYAVDANGDWDTENSLTTASFTCTYTAYTLTFVTDIATDAEADADEGSGESGTESASGTAATVSGSSVDSVEAIAGTVISLEEYTTTNTKYTFAGWYSDSTLKTAVTSVTLNGDITVYASWTQEETDLESVDVYLVMGDGIASNESGDSDGTNYTDQFADAINAETVENQASDKYESLEALREYIESGEMDAYIEQANVISLSCGQQDVMYAFYAAAAEIFNANKKASLPEITADDVKAIIDELNETTTKETSGLFSVLTAIADSNSNLGKAYDLFVLLNGEDYSGELSKSEVFVEAANAYVENMNSIVAEIKEVNPDVVVLVNNLYGPYQWLTGCDNLKNLCSSSVDYFNSELVTNQSGDYTIVDLNSTFKASSEAMTKAAVDLSVLSFCLDYYPNEIGYEMVSTVQVAAYTSAIAATTEGNAYTLSFETNGGTAVSAGGTSVSSVNVAEGTVVTLSDYTTTRSGYTFTGWYTDSSCTNVVTSLTMTADMTLYAGWQAEDTGSEGTEGDTGNTEDNDGTGDPISPGEETDNTEASGEEPDNSENDDTNNSDTNEVEDTEEETGTGDTEDTEEETDTGDTEATEDDTGQGDTEATEEDTGPGDTEDTEEDTGPGDTGSGTEASPKTGDGSMLWIWLVLAMLCMSAWGAAGSLRQKK